MQMQKDRDFDYFAKILMIGNSGVGKTNILMRYSQSKFSNSHMATIGIDFRIAKVQIDNKKIRLQIWDTAGQEKFKTVTKSYYNGCTGLFVVYAVNDRDSFNSIEHWISQAKANTSSDVIMILIGNKKDIDNTPTSQTSLHQIHQRQVTKQQGEKLAEKYHMDFFEVSAKAGINITEMFLEMSREIKEKVFYFDKSINGSPIKNTGLVKESSNINLQQARKTKEKNRKKNGKGCC